MCFRDRNDTKSVNHNAKHCSIMSYIISRWKRFRWLGLGLTAFYWAALVAAEATRTASEADESSPCVGSTIGGTRCMSRVDDTAFRVKWVAQLLNQIFQVRGQAKPSGSMSLLDCVVCTVHAIQWKGSAFWPCRGDEMDRILVVNERCLWP